MLGAAAASAKSFSSPIEDWARANGARMHWGFGMGRALFARLEAWAHEQNIRRLTGLVSAHNIHALRFAAR